MLKRSTEEEQHMTVIKELLPDIQRRMNAINFFFVSAQGPQKLQHGAVYGGEYLTKFYSCWNNRKKLDKVPVLDFFLLKNMSF